jgi:hypothetical protein
VWLLLMQQWLCQRECWRQIQLEQWIAKFWRKVIAPQQCMISDDCTPSMQWRLRLLRAADHILFHDLRPPIPQRPLP